MQDKGGFLFACIFWNNTTFRIRQLGKDMIMGARRQKRSHGSHTYPISFLIGSLAIVVGRP